jgi:hypothetical protein
MLREEDDGERHLAQQLAAINIELQEHSRAPPAAAASAGMLAGMLRNASAYVCMQLLQLQECSRA